MKRFPQQRWLIAILFIAGMGAVAMYVTQQRPPAAKTPIASPAVATASTHTGIFLQHITVQGRVGSPLGDVTKLAFAEAGTLARIDVHLGDRVYAGEPLAAIDQSAFAIALDQAHAGVAAAGALTSVYAKQRLAAQHLQTLQKKSSATRSEIITAQSQMRQATLKTATDTANLDRQQRLFAAGVVAEKDLHAAQDQLSIDQSDEQAAAAGVAAAKQVAKASTATAGTDLTVARGDVTTLQAQRQAATAQERSAQTALDRATLRSPVNGLVLAIQKHLGEAVDATAPVLEIGSASAMNATLAVPADQAQKIHPGDAVDLQNTNGEHCIGYITHVLPLVDESTQTATVTVSARIPNAVAGDVVTGSVTVAHIRGIVIPTTAIVQDPQTGQNSVFVRVAHPKADAPPFEQRAVHIGASDEKQAVITDGLALGETIAITGAYTLLAPNGG